MISLRSSGYKKGRFRTYKSHTAQEFARFVNWNPTSENHGVCIEFKSHNKNLVLIMFYSNNSFEGDERKACVVEISFLRANGRYFVKELAYYVMETDDSGVYTFKPPFPYKELSLSDRRLCSWITRHITSIQWNEGEYDYSQLDDLTRSISEMNYKFYTKGDEKSKTLTRYFGKPVENIEKLGCPKLEELPEPLELKCIYHEDNANCCLLRAYRIAQWLKKINL